MKKYTAKIGRLSNDEVGLAGGKGRCLDLMLKDKFSIPMGYIVLSRAFSDFIESNNIDLSLPPEIIRHKILRGIIPKLIISEILSQFRNLNRKYVAVRSSALVEDGNTASWAGELETYLNTTQINLAENVKKCWASFFSPRATIYRLNKKINDREMGMAVVVQEMVQSEVSGTCFTRHPIKKMPNIIYIEAIYGLGELLVSGALSPDGYMVDSKKWMIKEKNVEEQNHKMVKGIRRKTVVKVSQELRKQQKLTDNQVLELAKICKKLENKFKTPQDIEWAMENNKIFIVQSRPITV